jgi:hypothetical protein
LHTYLYLVKAITEISLYFNFYRKEKDMPNNKNKAKNQKQNKPPSSNKGNSQGMDTLQTTATDKNPDPRA